jgi:DNA-binding NtrC family response regulator
MITHETAYNPNRAVPVDAVRDELVPISLDDQVRAFEASLITWALTACRGNKSKAARLLNVKRSTLGDRICRCGLDQRAGGVNLEERR